MIFPESLQTDKQANKQNNKISLCICMIKMYWNDPKLSDTGPGSLLSSLRRCWNDVLDRHISWSRDCLRSAAMETRLEGLARWCVRDCLRSAAMETRLEGLARWCVCCYQRAGGVSGAGLVRRVSLCGDKTFTSRLVSPASVDQVVTGWSLSADTHTHTHVLLGVCLW